MPLFFSIFRLFSGIGRPQGFSNRKRPDSFERKQKKQTDAFFRNPTKPAKQIWWIFGREVISNMIPKKMYEVNKELRYKAYISNWWWFRYVLLVAFALSVIAAQQSLINDERFLSLLSFTLWCGICFSQTEINWRPFPKSPRFDQMFFYQTQNEKLPNPGEGFQGMKAFLIKSSKVRSF